MPKTKKRTNTKSTPRRLYLSNDKQIAGVCGGIAEYFNIDATLVRLGYVFLTIISGVAPGILAYIIAAAIMPKPVSRKK